MPRVQQQKYQCYCNTLRRRIITLYYCRDNIILGTYILLLYYIIIIVMVAWNGSRYLPNSNTEYNE